MSNFPGEPPLFRWLANITWQSVVRIIDKQLILPVGYNDFSFFEVPEGKYALPNLPLGITGLAPNQLISVELLQQLITCIIESNLCHGFTNFKLVYPVKAYHGPLDIALRQIRGINNYELEQVECPSTPELNIENPAEQLLIVPLGSTEQHGELCPLKTDTICVEKWAEIIAAKIPNSAVYPSIPYGVAKDLMPWVGTQDIDQTIYTNLVLHILESSIAIGFKKIMFLNFHGPNHQPIQVAVSSILESNDDVKIWNNIWKTVLGIESEGGFPCGDEKVKLVHAGSVETALAMHFCPDLITPECLQFVDFQPDEEVRITHDQVPEMKKLFPKGAWGNQAKATPGDGETISNMIVGGIMADAKQFFDI